MKTETIGNMSDEVSEHRKDKGLLEPGRIQPCTNRVLVEVLSDEVKPKAFRSILTITGGQDQEQVVFAEVIAVGPLVLEDDMKVGDMIVFPKTLPHRNYDTFMEGNKFYSIIPGDFVMAVIEVPDAEEH